MFADGGLITTAPRHVVFYVHKSVGSYVAYVRFSGINGRIAAQRIRELKERGIIQAVAVRTGCSRKGPWRLSRVKWVVMALPNVYFKSLGVYLLS